MELLLNFMYRGEINVEEAELMDLIATARGLSIRGLSDSDEDSNEQEVKHTNENSSSRQIPSSHASPSSNNVPKSHQTSKAVKRSKSPSQPSTSSGAMPEISLEPSASKKIKQESAVVHHAVPEVIEAYDNDSGGGEEEEAEEFENPEAVYVEGQEDQYNLEEGEGEDGMMYDGELPHPEVSNFFTYWSNRQFRYLLLDQPRKLEHFELDPLFSTFETFIAWIAVEIDFFS